MAGGVAQIAAGLASLTGATTGGIAFASFTPTLIAALLITGVAAIAIGMFALRGARIAWAFALSLHGTLFLVFLLATPTIRDLGMPAGIALLPAMVSGAITLLFAMSAQDY